MNLLAIDTSGGWYSAALQVGQHYHACHTLSCGQGKDIMGLIQTLFVEAGVGVGCLDAVAFGRGPGSFTGVRVACALAQGIGMAHDIPLLPVSSLAALAVAEPVAVNMLFAAMDARMGEMYYAAYVRHGLGLRVLIEESIGKPDALPVPRGKCWHGVGSAWASYREPMQASFGQALNTMNAVAEPSAEGVLQLAKLAYEAGEVISPEKAAPVYLRNQVAAKPKPGLP